MPKPVQAVYETWRCPYCFGFWVALTGHVMTQTPTLPLFVESLAPYCIAGLLGSNFLDALTSAVIIQVYKLSINAMNWPAIKEVKASIEFFGQP